MTLILSITLSAQNQSSQNQTKKLIVSDVDGNSFVAGNFSSATLRFGKIVLLNKGGKDVFIAKYDSHSKIMWAKNIGGEADETLESLTLNSAGNCEVSISSFSKNINAAGNLLKADKRGINLKANFNSSGMISHSIVKVDESISSNFQTAKANSGSSIKIKSPNSGASLKVGTKLDIKWTAQNIEYILIELSLDNGSTWQKVTSNSNDFLYSWVVPETNSSECLLRISDYDNPEVADTSGLFSIYGILQWKMQQTNYNSVLQDIYVANPSTTWAAGYDGLIETTNDGESWSSKLNGYCLFDVFFLDEKGWAVGLNGNIFLTTNSGKNWVEQSSGFDFRFEKIFFADENNGYIIGSGFLLKTIDGGQTWALQQPTEHVIENMYFINKDTGWISGGEGVILKTTDGGATWNYQQLNGTNYGTLSSLYFIDENTGWACGSGFDIGGGVILKTTDGGENWKLQHSGYNTFVYSVCFTNSNSGWAVGDEGIMFSTVDGGANWIEEGSGTLSDLYAVSLQPSSGGWVIGNDGVALRYIYESLVPVELTNFSVSLTSNKINLNWSTATETNNQGFEIERKTGANWQKIGFVDGKGTTTNLSNYNFTDDLESISKAAEVYYRLKQVDLDGTFSYSKVVNVKLNSLVNDYNLEQNFPNPFNPTTKIKYTIPGVVTKHALSVQIKVYDILGNEVATLVNEIQPAGNYEVSFNAANLASGTYIYSLKTGNFSQVKKMILLR